MSLSQVTIWDVDFETGYTDNDATAQDNNLPAGADWTKSGTASTWWRVESDNVLSGTLSMSGRNTDGVMTWTSESIDISGMANVSISIDISEVNCESPDVIETYYDIGAGNVEFGDGNGDGDFNSATNSVTGLIGLTLTIVVTLNNNGGGERLIFDNILVTGEPQLGYTGPGGVGDASSNELWLKADSGVYSDAGSTLASNGNGVQQWNDNSGNGNNASEGTASERATYQTNQVNGWPVLDFDGSNDRIMAPGLTTGNEATVLTVVKPEAFTNNNDGIIHAAPSGSAFSTSGSSKTIGMWIETATGEPWGRGVQSNNSSRSIPSVTPITTGSFYVITNDYDGGDITQYIDGATAGSISYDGTLNSWTDFGIGRQGSETFDGDIAEVIAYTSTLNDAQLIIVQNYLKAKYAITLTSNNIYTMDTPANGDFDYEVAGIGQASNGDFHLDAQGTGIVRIRNASSLDNSDFLIWGHNNEALNSTGVLDLPSGVEARLEREWRASESGEVGTVNISFDLSSVPGSKTASDLRLLIDTDNDSVFSDETASGVIGGATNTSGEIFEWTGIDIDNNQRFTIGTVNSSQTPLPITLLEFKVVPASNTSVLINWTTATEINNDFFTIERSADAENWEGIKRIEGGGNSKDQISYSTLDDNPIIGDSYYRLKQTDFDGNFTYSDIEAVHVKPASRLTNLEIYPNPSDGNVAVRFNSTVMSDRAIIHVFNAVGSQVYSEQTSIIQGENKVEISLNKALPGQYIVQLIDSTTGDVLQKSLIIK